MPCLSFKVSVLHPSALVVEAVAAAALSVATTAHASVSVKPGNQAKVVATATQQLVAHITPVLPAAHIMPDRFAARLRVSPISQPVLSLTTAPQVQPAVTLPRSPEMRIETAPQAELSVTTAPQSELAVTAAPQLSLTVGEVCSVSDGVLVVLAASDGPLRTRDGGYILLNPATNPPD